MAFEIRNGDLFKATHLDALAHGCNCKGAMGAGIAVEFKKRWPEMYKKYKILCEEGKLKLGDVFTWKTDTLTIFNLATQKSWIARAELNAIKTSVSEMIRQAEEMNLHSIGMPKIGAGLGRLDWNLVKEAIEEVAKVSKVKVIVFIR